ncbi:hypothetical protein [Sodalis glossinidius]|uniref:hypothetical protein n=1 Tax=Sodalis glossinidius TaxID=63612 RepID=UPI0011D0C366|nr:hypothetical protein [Sodalis glossinidius]
MPRLLSDWSAEGFTVGLCRCPPNMKNRTSVLTPSSVAPGVKGINESGVIRMNLDEMSEKELVEFIRKSGVEVPNGCST